MSHGFSTFLRSSIFVTFCYVLQSFAIIWTFFYIFGHQDVSGCNWFCTIYMRVTLGMHVIGSKFMCIVWNVQLLLEATDQSGEKSSQNMRVIVLQVVIPVFPQYTNESYRVLFSYTHTQTHTHTHAQLSMATCLVATCYWCLQLCVKPLILFCSFSFYGRPASQMRTLYFHLVVSSFFFFFFLSSPNLSGRRLDVYHTSTHGVALVQI